MTVTRTPAPIPPPRPVPRARGRRPLLGHSAMMNQDPLAFVEELREYGPIVRINIGPRPVWVVNSPELMHVVFTNQGFDKGTLNEQLSKPLGNGLVTSGGKFHRRQRRLMQPGFHAERIAGFVDVMAERTAARAATWTPDTGFDVVGEINKLTLDILLRTLFAGEPGPELRSAVKDWLTVKYRSARLAFSALDAWSERIPLLPRWSPPDPGPLERLRAVQQGFIEQYRADGRDRGDLLSMLIMAEGPEGSMNDREVGDELITLFLAGTGTVSAALAWTVYEVARRPEVQRQVQEEVDAVFGGRAPTMADVRSLSYTRRVATEILRLYPVAWMGMRRTTTRVRLGDYELPAGAEVFVSPYGLHRDPQYYTDPAEFRPERWPSSGHSRVPRDTYLPFSAGNSLCLGEDYAWALLVVALATFVSRWQMELVDDEPVRTLAGTVLRPDHVPIRVQPRSTPTSTSIEGQVDHVIGP